MPAPLSSKLDWELANPLWAQALNPILNNKISQGQLISGVSLIATTPKTINHGLNRMMTGWFVVDTTAQASIWRTKDLNDKTLTLEASATTTISIWCF